MVDVADDQILGGESDDGHAGRLDRNGEIGLQLFDEFQFVEEILGADGRRRVDQENQFDFLAGHVTQGLHPLLQHLAQLGLATLDLRTSFSNFPPPCPPSLLNLPELLLAGLAVVVPWLKKLSYSIEALLKGDGLDGSSRPGSIGQLVMFVIIWRLC